MAKEKERVRKSVGDWNGTLVEPGECKDIKLAVSESYSSMTVKIPIHVRRAKEPGPTVFVTAALHGDEINGTGAIRQLVQDENFMPIKGSVILVPVLNILGFDRHSRYLPDRRDLNRCFPGTKKGSLASRMAKRIFDEIVGRSDYGVDLHTAAVRRTNYPSIRADLSNTKVRQLAKYFGNEVVLDGKGPRGAFRREACIAGCPTIVLEAGEVWKVEPGIVQTAVRGVENVLRGLKMLEGEPQSPDHEVYIKKSDWVRAERGGFLQFHVSPGDFVTKGQPLASNTNLLGKEHSTLNAPYDAVIVGMTTLPAVSPGEPVYNLGKLLKGDTAEDLGRQRIEEDGLEEQVSQELASNVLLVEPNEED